MDKNFFESEELTELKYLLILIGKILNLTKFKVVFLSRTFQMTYSIYLWLM